MGRLPTSILRYISPVMGRLSSIIGA
jgi:hypothetical protein